PLILKENRTEQGSPDTPLVHNAGTHQQEPGGKQVRSQSHLVRRGAVYYFRARVPSDLVETVGKKEVKRSLQTSDHRQATLLAKEVALQVARDFEAIRRRLPANVDARRSPVRRSISGEEFKFLLG